MTRRALPLAAVLAAALLLGACVRRSLSEESTRLAAASVLRSAVRADTLRLAAHDTVRLRDTLRVFEERRGDTVYISRTRAVWRDRLAKDVSAASRLAADTIYIERRDSATASRTEAKGGALAQVPARALRLSALCGAAFLAAFGAVWLLRKK